MSLIVLFVGGILALVGIIWREYMLIHKYNVMEAQVKRIEDVVILEIQKMTEQMEPLSGFIAKAHTDLETIVKEYEINGIPLGYDRGKKADYVEGL